MSSTRGARVRACWFGAIVTLTDLLPPRIRYGYVHRITGRLLARPLPAVGRIVTRPVLADGGARAVEHDLVCGILADHLDVGGIGSVVEMLALGLGAEGVRPVVICHGDGERAQRLRDAGVEVHAVGDGASATAAIAASSADVLQVHSAPVYLEVAAAASTLPLITVMHNTEIHYTAAKWAAYSALMERSTAGVAVSATVRDYHARRLDPALAARLEVVPNGAPALAAATADDRRRAREAVAAAIGAPLDGAIVFASLARYDSQKNVAGAAIAFARAAARDDDLHLVLAGTPADRAELERARAVAEAAGAGGRIHFLGNSDPVTLLTAADAFLLDSFFEGWPVAATEAAAAGLPLVLSEVGGAAELVALDPAHSVMTPNPAGDAAGVSDALVRRARRRTRRQPGRDALVAALLETAARARETGVPLPARTSGGVREMLAGHARVARAAAAAGVPTGAA